MVPNHFLGAALIATTRIPEASDICHPSGSGFVMAINPFTGGRLDSTFFDVNRDGQFTSADEMTVGGSDRRGQAAGRGHRCEHRRELERLRGDRSVHAVPVAYLRDGSTQIQVPATAAGRMSWREIVN